MLPIQYATPSWILIQKNATRYLRCEASYARFANIQVGAHRRTETFDLGALKGIPQRHPTTALLSSKVLRIRRVCHTLDPQRGFVTRMEFRA